MPNIQMSHGTNMNEWLHTHGWFMSHKWMSHGTHMNDSWHTYEWVMAQIWMSHCIHMDDSCHTNEYLTRVIIGFQAGSVYTKMYYDIYIYISTHKKTTHLNESLKLLGNPIRKGRPLPLIHWYNISQMLACQQIYYAHWLCGWFWEI